METNKTSKLRFGKEMKAAYPPQSLFKQHSVQKLLLPLIWEENKQWSPQWVPDGYTCLSWGKQLNISTSSSGWRVYFYFISSLSDKTCTASSHRSGWNQYFFLKPSPDAVTDFKRLLPRCWETTETVTVHNNKSLNISNIQKGNFICNCVCVHTNTQV